MKLLIVGFLFLLLNSNCIAQTDFVNTDSSFSPYNRKRLLDTMCIVLYGLKKNYSFEFPTRFYIRDEQPVNFFVYDLNDTTNNSVNNSIKIIEGHFYHFAPKVLYFSYSNIFIVKDGKVHFFLALNCKHSINKIEEVIGFAKCVMANDSSQDSVILNIKKYRTFGKYLKMDMNTCKCE